MTDLKPGYKTTEFWGKNVLQVVSIALAVYVSFSPGSLTGDQQQSIMVVAGLVVPPAMEMLYGFNRSWLKRAHELGAAHTTAKSRQ